MDYSNISEVTPELFDNAMSAVAMQIKKAGLRVEDHMRISDLHMCITKQAIKTLGMPKELLREYSGAESLDGVGLPRDGSYTHRLSEVTQKEPNEDDGYLNSWAFASVAINAALGWEPSNDGGERAARLLSGMVLSVQCSIDVGALMEQARYSDNALRRLAVYANEGFSKCAAEA